MRSTYQRRTNNNNKRWPLIRRNDENLERIETNDDLWIHHVHSAQFQKLSAKEVEQMESI